MQFAFEGMLVKGDRKDWNWQDLEEAEEEGEEEEEGLRRVIIIPLLATPSPRLEHYLTSLPGVSSKSLDSTDWRVSSVASVDQSPVNSWISRISQVGDSLLRSRPAKTIMRLARSAYCDSRTFPEKCHQDPQAPCQHQQQNQILTFSSDFLSNTLIRYYRQKERKTLAIINNNSSTSAAAKALQ